jgi:DNA-binding GntR family transcriptional regulator
VRSSSSDRFGLCGAVEPLSSGGPGHRAPAFTTKSQLSDNVAAYVRELIMSGQVRQGQYLRLERLAEALAVSPTPVREGLLSLRGEGFVQLEPRRGFVVSPLSRQDVHDLFLVQANVAGELAARAAGAIDDDALQRIVGLQASLETAALGGNPEAIEEANYQFHRAVNLLANSPKLGWMLTTVVRYAPRRFYATIHGWQQASVQDHHSIVSALRAHSPDVARNAMRQHILHAGELLVAHLDSTRFWDDDSDGTQDRQEALRAAAPREADDRDPFWPTTMNR